LVGKPLRIDRGELADEWEQRDVGKAAGWAAQVRGAFQPCLQRVQHCERFGAVVDPVRLVTAGIFGAVEMVFERAIIGRNQRRIIARQPGFGITLRQCPAHDGKAFAVNRPALQHQHRDGRLG